METKQKSNDIIRLYKLDEIKAMNYILSKKEDNKVFTEFELELINTIDLFNKKLVEVCKCIYERECKKI